mgnify:CR=1 FL=1
MPYDSEVEYLESTGTQWINTGHETNGVGITIDVVASKTTSATNEMAIAGRVASVGFELYIAKGMASIWTQSFYVASSVGILPNIAYHITAVTDSNRQSISVDGVVDSQTGSVTSSAVFSPIALFTHRKSYMFVGRIYSCKIHDGATLVRDFIPVSFTNELGEQEGGLYDKISMLIFRNQGSGAFVIGPEV